jgi:HEAT repeat protein
MMVPSLKPVGVCDPEAGAVDPVLVRDVAAWMGQLVRALKTCRLYHEANPTVVRFREELAGSLATLLASHGTLRLEVGSNTLSCAGHQVHAGRSREDNLAGVLHRDGIRLLTLELGIEARELDVLLDKILQVTGPAAVDDDLVTLLWDAALPHVAVETVAIENEADGSADDDAERASDVAWPKQQSGAAPLPAGSAAPLPAGSAAPLPAGSAPLGPEDSRSDDWTTNDDSTGIEQAFDEIETTALTEIARFQQEYDASLQEDIVIGTIRILQDCLASDLTENDREILADFIPRVLLEALALGDWRTAAVALRLIRTCDPQWSVEEFSQTLCGPLAITTRKVVAALDGQDPVNVESFLTLAPQFGSTLVEWLMHVLAESMQMRVRRPLAKTIAELLVDHPEHILPWVSDERWYVVRNVVYILGLVGGDGIASYLRVPAEHPEPRVRREVVAALSQVSRDASRPILVGMLKGAEPQLFGTIVQQLAMDDHPSLAETLLELLRDETFGVRSAEERHGLFLALATRGDVVLAALEAELYAGGLFSRRPDPDRPAIALCVARIGTPAARAILARGLRSNRGSVRKACLIAGASGDASDD